MINSNSQALDFLRWIDAQPALLSDEWVARLESRKRAEIDFHDADRQDHRDEDPASTSNRRFYDAAGIVQDYVQRWIEASAPGRVFLDYACGNGKMTLLGASAGAGLSVGIDISPVSVTNSRDNALQAGLGDRCRFLQRDCEATGFPPGSFDICLCSGMLHHLDLSAAFPELHRIMKSGGRILGVEALAYNPAIQLYRRLTPHLRTEFERNHILSLRELRLARRWFRVENVRFFLMAAPLFTLLPAGPIRRGGIALGHAIDAVATRIPFLNLMSWQMTFELVKPA
jgi:SAM-dependent methyltransferase